MARIYHQALTRDDVERLLNKQTLTILSAVDEKMTRLERRLVRSETRINQKLDRLATTLDKFLKRLTDIVKVLFPHPSPPKGWFEEVDWRS